MLSSELCYVYGGVRGYCICLGDVAFYDQDKKKLSFRGAQRALSMSIVIMGSKTDQARVWCTRKLDRAGLEIDVLDAVANMLQSRSDKWLSNPLRPLFELASGEAVSGARILEALKGGAADLGLDPRRYATHSLLWGGATTMVATGIPIEAIRQWGRWLSGCWCRCVFGTAEELEHMPRAMVMADYTLAMAD